MARDQHLVHPPGDVVQHTIINTCPSVVTAVRFGRVPKREKARILAAMQQSSNSRSLEKAVSAELEDEQRLLATVVRAHIDTCDFTRDKVEPMLARAREHPTYTACPPTLVSVRIKLKSKKLIFMCKELAQFFSYCISLLTITFYFRLVR